MSTGQLSQRRSIEFKFNSFEEFLAAVGPKPRPHSKCRFDGINPIGQYEVGNVRCVTISINLVNRRDSEAKLNFPLLPVQSEGGADVAAGV